MFIHDTVDINLSSGKTVVHCNHTDKQLDQLLAESLAPYKSPVVLVSGGLDSQLSAHWAKLYTSNPTAIIYDFTWNSNTVNASDLLMAQRFCEKIDMPYKIITVDLTHFLSHELQTVAKRYQCTSPQVLSHIWAILCSDFPPGTNVIMGGERHFVMKTPDDKVAYGIERGTQARSGFYRIYYSPFYTLADELGINMIRDPGILSPEIHYHMIRANLDAIDQFGEICIEQPNTLNNNKWKFKRRYYETFGHDFIWPLSKKTGFEPIQLHLAAVSGVYNQFDILYRRPLQKLCEQERWFGPRGPITKVVGGGLEHIMNQAQDLITNRTLEVVNTYDLNW